MGDAPHDRRGDGATEVAMQLREGDPSGELSGHQGQDTVSGAPLVTSQPASGTIRPSASIVACRRSPLELGAGDLVASVVARAHERCRLDVLEAERKRGGLHLGELVGVVVALEREVLQRGPQVLADGQDVDVVVAQCLERLLQLLARLAEADHQARSSCGPDSRSRVPSPWLGAGRIASGPSGPACGPASGGASRSRGCG